MVTGLRNYPTSARFEIGAGGKKGTAVQYRMSTKAWPSSARVRSCAFGIPYMSDGAGMADSESSS